MQHASADGKQIPLDRAGNWLRKTGKFTRPNPRERQRRMQPQTDPYWGHSQTIHVSAAQREKVLEELHGPRFIHYEIIMLHGHQITVGSPINAGEYLAAYCECGASSAGFTLRDCEKIIYQRHQAMRPREHCKHCGKEVQIAIFRGTGWCSDDCRKALTE